MEQPMADQAAAPAQAHDDTRETQARVAPDPPAPPGDAENPAIIDARKTFIITMVSSVLFIGVIVLFIL